MKFLDYPELELLSRALTFESAECKVFTRLEAYSCKAVSRDKKLFKALENAYARSASTSPPSYLEEALASPFGKLDQPAARKTLWLLISTLNGAFPDHEFAEVNPADFRRERSAAGVLNSLSTTLLSLRSSSGAPRSFSSFPSSYDDEILRAPSSTASTSLPATSKASESASMNHPALASILDDLMCVPECEVYTYHPDVDSDPHACADPDEGYADEDEPWAEDDMEEQEDAQSYEAIMYDDTPRAQDEDVPMFDEDMYDAGLDGKRSGAARVDSNASSSSLSSEPKTPRTPRDVGASGSYFGRSAATFGGRVDGHFDAAEEDELDDMGGLLWATYVFFYNRKLKRILFVDVWSRRQAVARPRAPISYTAPAPFTSAGFGSEPAHGVRLHLETQQPITPLQSPAKRAISTRTSRKRRAPSGSPAPSALSPFPHASPQAKTASDVAAGLRPSSVRTSSALARGAMRSLDEAVLSSSAPASALDASGSAAHDQGSSSKKMRV